MYWYLNDNVEKWIKLDPAPHRPHGELEDPIKGKQADWTHYYDSQEEIDWKGPESNGLKSLETTIYFDSNHAHDEVTRRSVTGVLIYVGSCPIFAISKRQGSIATSTYSAEICAARVGTEEAVNICCMLRALGVPCKVPTKLIGDNMGSLISVKNPGTPCKRKTTEISYHFVRERSAQGTVEIWKIGTDFNLSDAFTKPLPKKLFNVHMNRIFSKLT